MKYISPKGGQYGKTTGKDRNNKDEDTSLKNSVFQTISIIVNF